MATSQIVHCPPFCYVDCKTQHHPLILALINVRNPSEQYLLGLEAVMKRYEQLGEWDKDASIPDPNPQYKCPLLHWAAALGEVFLVKWLLYNKKCRAASQCSETGDTVIHRTIHWLIDNTKLKNTPMVKVVKDILPHFKGNLIMKDLDGNTPLHLCCASLQRSKREYYMQWINAMIDIMTDHPLTLLNVAVNSQNNDGNTPLHMLAEFTNNFNLMKSILESQKPKSYFKLGLKNNKNMTVLDVAIKQGNAKISTYLNLFLQTSSETPPLQEKTKYMRKRVSPGSKEQKESPKKQSTPKQTKRKTNSPVKNSNMKKSKSESIKSTNSSFCTSPSSSSPKNVQTATANLLRKKLLDAKTGRMQTVPVSSLSRIMPQQYITTDSNVYQLPPTENSVQTVRVYPKFSTCPQKGAIQYAVFPRSQVEELNSTSKNNSKDSVVKWLNKTGVKQVQIIDLTKGSNKNSNSPKQDKLNSSVQRSTVHIMPKSPGISLTPQNILIQTEAASSSSVKSSVKTGEDGVHILTIESKVPGNQNQKTNYIGKCEEKGFSLTQSAKPMKYYQIEPTLAEVTATRTTTCNAISSMINKPQALAETTTFPSMLSKPDTVNKANPSSIAKSLDSTTVNLQPPPHRTSLSASIPSSRSYTSILTSSVVSPTISSTTSSLSGQKRKATSTVTSSSQEPLIKYIKIEDEDSEELAVSSGNHRVTSPDNLIHSSVSDSELQQTGNLNKSEPLQSPLQRSTGYTDSPAGKGIMSYLSMCSDIKQEFLDKLLNDKEKFIVEKHSIEKKFQDAYNKNRIKVSKMKSKTEMLNSYLEKVAELQQEVYIMSEEMKDFNALEKTLKEEKEKVETQLETCENAISDFNSMSS